MKSRLVRVMSLVAMPLVLALVVAGCGGVAGDAGAGSSSPDVSVGAEAGGDLQLTKAELAEFDGKDGRPAYVAVDGVVYDVSASASWPEGAHSRCDLGASAGKDLSEIIRQAPSNMRALLARMPVVGALTE